MTTEPQTAAPLSAEEEAQWRGWLASGHMPYGTDAVQGERIARLLATLAIEREARSGLDAGLREAAQAVVYAHDEAPFQDGLEYAVTKLRAALASSGKTAPTTLRCSVDDEYCEAHGSREAAPVDGLRAALERVIDAYDATNLVHDVQYDDLREAIYAARWVVREEADDDRS